MDNARTQRGGFARRMMQSNLRPVVLFIAFATGLWAFLWAISSFRLVTDPNVGEVPGLKVAALSMGILYTIATIVQLFGLFAVSMRKLSLVRIYAFGSILTALCVLAGSLTQIIVHFAQKKALLAVCTSDTTGDTIFYSWGIWGPVSSTTLSQTDAAQWCNDAWNRASWRNILSLLIQICVAAFFLFVIFGYYKQLQDPNSAAHGYRIRNQYPLGTYPQEQYVGFPPPQGPPPAAYGLDQPFVPPYDSAKLPTYDGSQRNYNDTKDGDGLLKNGDDDPFGDHRGDIGRSDSGQGNTRR